MDLKTFLPEIQASLEKTNIFSDAVKVVEAAKGMVAFSNGESHHEDALQTHSDISAVELKIVEWLKLHVDVPFIDGALEEKFEAFLYTIAVHKAAEVAKDLAFNAVEGVKDLIHPSNTDTPSQ